MATKKDHEIGSAASSSRLTPTTEALRLTAWPNNNACASRDTFADWVCAPTNPTNVP